MIRDLPVIRIRPTLLLVVCLGMLLLMPSSDSLWVDEGITAPWTKIPSFSGLLTDFLAELGSEGQMPFYIFFTWAMGHILGTSEWAMRSPNLLWGAMAVTCLFLAGKKIKVAWLPALLVVHPFFWFYMNEARPYAMQIGLGSLLLFGFVLFLTSNRKDAAWAWTIATAGFLLCASSLLGVVPVCAVLLFIAVTWIRERFPLTGSARLAIVLLCVLLVPLGLFYLWTLRKAAGARVWTPGFSSIGFSLFEFSGAAGFSPSRDEIRTLAKAKDWMALLRECVVPCVIFLVAYGVFTWKSMSGNARRWLHTARPYAVVILTVLGLMLLLSVLANWPFWGRHLAPMLPFWLVVMALAMSAVWNSSSPGWRWGLCGFVGLLLLSGFFLRFAPGHKKDDYRTASRFAKKVSREGKTVWWVAAPGCATYYGLNMHDDPLVILAYGLPLQAIDQPFRPDFIIISKPDLCDIPGTARKIVRTENYRLVARPNAFLIYQRPY